MMTVYLAAPWKHREEARAARALLTAAGVHVNSRWLDFESANDKTPANIDGYDPVILEREANYDLEDIRRADAVVVLNLCVSEGKAVEQGYAIARGIPILIVGKRSSVFHYLPSYQVQIVDTLSDALNYLLN